MTCPPHEIAFSKTLSLAPGFSRVFGGVNRRETVLTVSRMPGVEVVGRYIANQETHHQKKSFSEELKLLVERYGLEWHEEENR